MHFLKLYCRHVAKNPSAKPGFLLYLVASLGLPLVGASSYAERPDRSINYAEDIRPILERRCIECHQPGQIAPMSLTTFPEVRPWAKSIRKQVRERTMPPFHATGPVGRYVDDPRLTDQEISAIVAWVDSGCPPGALLADEGHPNEVTDSSEWKLGIPDLIIEFEPMHANGNSEDIFRLAFAEESINGPIWVDAIDVVHSDFRAVHHSNVRLFPDSIELRELIETKGFTHLWEDTSELGNLAIHGWLPGQRPSRRAPFRIPDGFRLGLESHLAPTDQTLEIQSKLGIYLFSGAVTESPEFASTPLIPPIRIPPGEPNYQMEHAFVFPSDSLIRAHSLHMHYRGKSGTVSLEYPDGAKHAIFEIPRYDFHWQRQYRLATPIRAPKGTRAVFRSTWDNSAANPNNPDPSQRVRVGLKTSDEMWISTLEYVVEGKREPRKWIHRGKEIEVYDPQGEKTFRHENCYTLDLQ